MKKLYLTCDIGGTDLKYGIINDDFELLVSFSVPTKADEGGLAIVNQIIGFYNDLKDNYDISAISISAAGIINPITTEVLDATGSIQNYIGLNFRDEINKQINIDVSAENDVNCVGLAEANLGAGKDYHNVVALTIGTGIGGSIIREGNLYHGSSYNAGEWGRTIIDYKNYIKFEDLASTRSLVNFAKEVNPSIKNGVDVFNLYDNNDQLITPIVNNFYYNLSIGLLNVIYTYNPDLIILGGGITARGDKFLDELMKEIKPKISPYFFKNFNIRLAKFKNNAGMIGALLNYKSRF